MNSDNNDISVQNNPELSSKISPELSDEAKKESDNNIIISEENQGSNEIKDELKYIKYAWIATVFSAVCTLIFSFLGTYNEAIKYRYEFDIWSLLDVTVLVGLAYGIYRKNRYCALSMFLYFLFSKFTTFASTGNFSGGLVSIMFLAIFFRGTMAAFRVYKYRIKIGEIKQKTSSQGIKRYLKIGSLTALVLSFILLIFAADYGPSTEVIPGEFLKKEYMEFMKQEGLISPREKIDYWYSDAFLDFKKGFYFITENKVVMYSSDWVEPAIVIPYSDIADIQYYFSDSFYVDSEITLILKDFSALGFPVSSENSGDKRFVQRLLDNWRKIVGGEISYPGELLEPGTMLI